MEGQWKGNLPHTFFSNSCIHFIHHFIEHPTYAENVCRRVAVKKGNAMIILTEVHALIEA